MNLLKTISKKNFKLCKSSSRVIFITKEKDIIEKTIHSFELIGKSPDNKVKKIIEKLSTSDSRVLISGPTGTGKELVARKIHKNSSRSKIHLF